MGYRISIAKDLCTGCGNCAQACPATTARKNKTIISEEGSLKPILQIKHGSSKLVDEEGCGLCGVCILACPPRAIDIEEV